MPSHGFPGPRLACQGQTRLSLILLRKRTDAEYSSEGLQHSLLESTVTRSSFRASGVSLTGLSPASVDNTRLAVCSPALLASGGNFVCTSDCRSGQVTPTTAAPRPVP